jgi:hypothetical protein
MDPGEALDAICQRQAGWPLAEPAKLQVGHPLKLHFSYHPPHVELRSNKLRSLQPEFPYTLPQLHDKRFEAIQTQRAPGFVWSTSPNAVYGTPPTATSLPYPVAQTPLAPLAPHWFAAILMKADISAGETHELRRTMTFSAVLIAWFDGCTAPNSSV